MREFLKNNLLFNYFNYLHFLCCVHGIAFVVWFKSYKNRLFCDCPFACSSVLYLHGPFFSMSCLTTILHSPDWGHTCVVIQRPPCRIQGFALLVMSSLLRSLRSSLLATVGESWFSVCHIIAPKTKIQQYYPTAIPDLTPIDTGHILSYSYTWPDTHRYWSLLILQTYLIWCL